MSYILPTNYYETWEEHFVNNGWSTPQDQIDAGYPYYLQPALASGFWTRVVDLGQTFAAGLITLVPDIDVIDGDPTWEITLAASADGVTWDFTGTGVDLTATTPFRYVRVRIDVASDATLTGLLAINSLRLTVITLRKTEQGIVTALSADVAGTVVTFTKTYTTIESINLSVIGSGYARLEYEYDTTTITVRVYDESDNRITRDVSWAVTGA